MRGGDLLVMSLLVVVLLSVHLYIVYVPSNLLLIVLCHHTECTVTVFIPDTLVPK